MPRLGDSLRNIRMLELNGREKLRCIAESRSVQEVRAVYAAATRRAAPSR